MISKCIEKLGWPLKCRFCDEHPETIDHLVSGCTILVAIEYKTQHDNVGQYLHCKIYNLYMKETARN